MAHWLSLVVIAAGASLARARDTVSVDLGWRFNLGSDAPGSCLASYPIPVSDHLCKGLANTTMSGAPSAAGCEAAACAVGAAAWQFCPGGAACGAQPRCSIGYLQSNCTESQAGWVGGTQNISTPLPVWTPPAAVQSFDDSAWQTLDIPHDMAISGNYTQSADKGEGFLPYKHGFYRKHFRLPLSWNTSVIELHLEGALSTSTWWLNGAVLVARNYAGYTPLIVRLDGVPGAPLRFGDSGGDNVLVAFVDGSLTTGWWYEGSGLIRRATLSAAFPQAHVVTHSLRSAAFVDGGYHARATPAEGLYADSASLSASVVILNLAGSQTRTVVRFSVFAPGSTTPVAVGNVSNWALPNRTQQSDCPPLSVTNAELWSVARPFLYTLVVEVFIEGTSGPAVDALNASIGIRTIGWDPEQGMRLNDQNVKMRGFCNHESFAGVGGAIPARIDLLRLQQLRGVGGNAWRTSHNPPEPVLLELTDRLGVMVMDENRVFSTVVNCPGCVYVPEYAGNGTQDMVDMVARDRTHASVVLWSFCNEAGCGQYGGENPAVEFKLATYNADGSRAVGANMGWISPVHPTPMSDILDVMGMSHASRGDVVLFHTQQPEKPLVMSECCSCETQRGEDADRRSAWSPGATNSDENSVCLRDEVQTSNAVAYVAGTFVWTLHDYYGEPDNWPHISSSFGSYDLAGFVKAPVYWYRSWWLANVSEADAGRPPIPNSSIFVHLVESWTAPAGSGTTRNLTVYTNAPQARLLVNGAPIGSPFSVLPFSAATFHEVTYSPGTITAQALDATGAVLLTHARSSWGTPAAIVLRLDAPHADPAQGVGTAVYLDGRDVALVRATIVDAGGNVCADSTLNVTFAVSAGPGTVWGVGNGDPSCQDPNHVAWRRAYHGLVRAIVRVTLDASGTAAERALQAQVNVDAGRTSGAVNASSSILLGPNDGAPTSLTVTAVAPGLPMVSLQVRLSVDPADSVLAVAAAGVATAYIGD